jgi:outer membrane protein TolC
LSAEDARDMVMLTVGNAYLLVLADQTNVSSVQAQVSTAKVSLDQAVDNHQAGTAPLLDELRARVDYQSLEQQLIAAQDSLEKDKLALARTIGLPLAQSFNLTDTAPYAPFDQLDAARSSSRPRQIARIWPRSLKKPRPRPTSAKRRPPRVFPPSSRRRLRRHRHHAGPLARHRGCDRLAQRAGL